MLYFKMAGKTQAFAFLLFCFNALPLLQAAITSPDDGSVIYGKLGENITIQWIFNDSIADVLLRSFAFNDTELFQILLNQQPTPGTGAALINNVDIVEPSSIIIKEATRNNEGEYKFGLITEGIKQYSRTVDVIVTEKPYAYIRCRPRLYNIYENENISCLCNTIGGNPPPAVVWLKNGKPITSGGFLRQTLKITNASKNDSGLYVCKATSHTLTDTDSLRILIRYKPIIESFTINSKSKYVERGSSVLFTCKVDAATSVKLYHNGSELNDFNNGKCIINAVSSVHNGNYQCVAENDVGKRTSRNIKLEVVDKPEFVFFDASSGEVELGSAVIFFWVISAFPSATVRLFHNGSEITDLYDRKYIIKSVTYDQSGKYHCEAKNEVALVKSKIITLKVTDAVANAKANKDNKDSRKMTTRNDWYIAVITFLCGLLIGAIVIYYVIKIRHRVTNQPKEEQQNANVYDEVIPSGAQPSVYEEVNLKDMNQPGSYQAVKRDVGGGQQSNNCVGVKDSDYQELNNPRGRSVGNYQTLQKT